MTFNIRHALRALALTAIAAATLTACDDEPSQEVANPTNLTLVTLSQYTSSGMVMTYRTGETTPLISLTTPLRFDTAQIKLHDRVIIGYDIPDGRPANTDGPITLLSYRTVYNDTIRPATRDILANWSIAPVSQTQVWRTGNYINAVAYVPLVQPMQYLTLWADEATIENGECTMYLTLSNPMTEPAQRADVYSSFNIKPFLRRHPDVTTFKINVASAYGEPLVTFSDVHILAGE